MRSDFDSDSRTAFGGFLHVTDQTAEIAVCQIIRDLGIALIGKKDSTLGFAQEALSRSFVVDSVRVFDPCIVKMITA